MSVNTLLPPTMLIKNFIKTHVPSIKRVGAGHLELMRLFLNFKRKNISIELDDERFIHSSEMQNCTRDYQKIREVCFIMKGYSNHLDGTCNLIVGYTPQFDELFITTLQSLSKLRKQHNSHTTTTTLYLVNKSELDQKLDNDFGTFTPGADPMNYTKTEKSERYYIWLQNIPRSDKKELYAGCHDLDITAAFPNIFWQEICGYESSNKDMRLMIEDPEAFLNKCIDDDIFNKIYRYKGVAENNRDRAKQARSRLFHPPESGRPRKSGVEWYDNLQTYIIGELKAVGVNAKGAHLYFTNREQKIVNIAMKVVGEQHVVLRMHDGFIVDSCVEVDHYLMSELAQQTGYRWQNKLL